MILAKFRLKAAVKVTDGSNYILNLVAYQEVFYSLTTQHDYSWQRLCTTNVAMAAFIGKQSREILVPSLPLRLHMLLKLCHVTLRPQIALFTVSSARLHYNKIWHVCEAISGYFVVLARNRLASTLDYMKRAIADEVSLRTWEQGKTACGRLEKQTSVRKTRLELRKNNFRGHDIFRPESFPLCPVIFSWSMQIKFP